MAGGSCQAPAERAHAVVATVAAAGTVATQDSKPRKGAPTGTGRHCVAVTAHAPVTDEARGAVGDAGTTAATLRSPIRGPGSPASTAIPSKKSVTARATTTGAATAASNGAGRNAAKGPAQVSNATHEVREEDRTAARGQRAAASGGAGAARTTFSEHVALRAVMNGVRHANDVATPRASIGADAGGDARQETEGVDVARTVAPACRAANTAKAKTGSATTAERTT